MTDRKLTATVTQFESNPRLEALQDAFDRYNELVVEPTRSDTGLVVAPFYLVDSATAEPEVNWPGELIGEFKTWRDASLYAYAMSIDYYLQKIRGPVLDDIRKRGGYKE